MGGCESRHGHAPHRGRNRINARLRVGEPRRMGGCESRHGHAPHRGPPNGPKLVDNPGYIYRTLRRRLLLLSGQVCTRQFLDRIVFPHSIFCMTVHDPNLAKTNHT